ncbi:MAG: tetratricopeptide repeat protein [Acidobacteria bacterium]|nr:tetratricopeptide repeat protein [Acidobacteriota bacterium]
MTITVLTSLAAAQTFDVGGQGKSPRPQQGASPDFAWGAGIAVARQVRAAQDALAQNDYAAAASHAEQATKAAPQDPELWFLLGYAARLANRYQVSVDAYQQGLHLRPSSIRGLGGLAQTYIKLGRDAEARGLLNKVIQANPQDADSLALAGELFLDSDPARALELLRRAESLRASAHTELLIARAYLYLHQPEEARSFLNRARNRAPQDPDVLRAIAGQYREAGHYNEAIAALRAVPAKTPDVLAELAYTYELSGDKPRAADTYAAAAKASKGNIALQLSAAQAMANLGQMDAARNFLERARSLDSNHYRLHATSAQIAIVEERISDAEREYELALQNLPKNPPEGPLYRLQMRLHLYELQQQQGEQDKAKQQLALAAGELREIQVPISQKPEYLRLRAAVETQSGDLQAAHKDLEEALALAPGDMNSLANYATLQWKLGQKEAARRTFETVLQKDPNHRAALTSLGFLMRDMGDAKAAEQYFQRAAKLYPQDPASHLALGDLYSAERNYAQAEASYAAAYPLDPKNPLVIAGATNAALEAHDLGLAKAWLDRSHGVMNDNPAVMRERQRYLTWKQQYQEAADLGAKVLEKLPRDRQAPVYLAYDLYYLGRYQEALEVANKYDALLPNNRDLALIAGYVHTRNGRQQEALTDFTRAIERDPSMATGYVNRGYVLNTLREPARAAEDFRTALRLQKDSAEAHLGLAYAYLQLRRSRSALAELNLAQKSLGDNRAWHLARAEGYRQEQNFQAAEKEYRVALKEVPDDLTTQLALAETLYHLRRYQDSIAAYNEGLKLTPQDPGIYAALAQNYARLAQPAEAMRNIQLAEARAGGRADIFMMTGHALLTMGDRDAAMNRFSRALETQNSVGTRLAIGEIFVRDQQWDDARRQIALAFADARTGEAAPVTSADFLQAANLFLAMHDFDLAETYFDKARRAGADERSVALGLANTYLAQGNTRQAEAALAGLEKSPEYQGDYDYLMTSAAVYRQRQDTLRALSAFAQASTLASREDEDDLARAQYEMAEQEGRQITPTFSLSSQATFSPQLEDINVYTLDARMLRVTDPAQLPTPRHSFQSMGAAPYRVHLNHWPVISGFVGESMTSGRISLPSINSIEERHTFDTILNGGIDPVLRVGSSAFLFHGGLQFTVRRDTVSSRDMDQNLFRQFLYVSSTPLFNWVTVQANASRETGPFVEQGLHSRDLSGSLEFTVGRPWGNTALIVGYSARDLLFRPAIREYYTTSSYVGVQRHLGKRFTLAVLGEYLRSWRVDGDNFAIAQAMRPAVRFEYRPSLRWSVQGSFALSRGQGFHAYDNTLSEFLVSYVRPVHRNVQSGGESASVAYPMRFSFGLQQQTFYNFSGSNRTAFLPVVRLNLF